MWVIETVSRAPSPVRARPEQRGDDLERGGQPARGEVGDLDGRQRPRCVGERAGPAEVVDVVTGALLVAVAGTEDGDRAEDGRVRHSDAEPLEHAGAEAVEDDVGAGAEGVGESARRPPSGRRRPTPCRR